MKRAAIAVAVLVLLLAGAGVAYYLHVKQQSRDVKGSSTVEFVTTQEAVPARPKEPGVAWPTYGHDPQRLRFANGVALAPPFKRVWTYRARTLVEFPPAVAYGRLFFANNAGVLFAIGAKNGRKAWSYVSHRCVASSPAVAGHVVYETFMNAPPCNRKPSGKLTGELIAFTVGRGRVLWRKTIYPSESSPVVTAGSVFVGDWSGRIYAFKQRSGKLRWVRKLRGQVKSGVSIAGEQLYVGDYSGHVYALDIRSGKILWQAKAQRRFGHAGNFYGSPAVAYGRVYIGATDGKVYSFGASSGKLRWSQSTGGFVYASPAVWRDRVFAGSYSHRFFAFDAATGAILWQFTGQRPDLRLGDGGRRPRLLRDAQRDDVRTRCDLWPPGLDVPRRQVLTGRRRRRPPLPDRQRAALRPRRAAAGDAAQAERRHRAARPAHAPASVTCA